MDRHGVTKSMLSVTVLNEKLNQYSHSEDLKKGFAQNYYQGVSLLNNEIW
jgi:hypothetical protein